MISEKTGIRYINFNTPGESIAKGEALNLLAGAIGKEKDMEIIVSVWGRITDEWKELTKYPFMIEAKEHKHMYFHVPGECFTNEFWNTDELEEMEIAVNDEMPKCDEKGLLVFIK